MFVNRKITGDCPLWPAYALCRLIEFGCHIKIANLRLATIDGVKDNQGVDLQVGKVKIDVDTIETNDKVDQRVFLLGRHVLEQGVCYLFPRWEWLRNGNIEHETLCVDITNIDTALVREENVVPVTRGRDTDVIFSVGSVWKERFDNKVVQGPSDGLDLAEEKTSEKQCHVGKMPKMK